MNAAVISIGSNIDPVVHVAAAIDAMARGHRLLAQSRLVQTKAIDRPDQPDYLNGAVLIETELSRDGLRDWLKNLETTLGRVRSADKFAARTIDLDIVVWNGEVIDDDVFTRDFLRAAVLEVLPQRNGSSR